MQKQVVKAEYNNKRHTNKKKNSSSTPNNYVI